MIETYAWPLVSLIDSLAFLRQSFEARAQRVKDVGDLESFIVTQQDRENFDELHTNFKRWLIKHELTGSLDSIRRIADEFTEDEPSISTIVSRMESFRLTMEDELRRRIFLYVFNEDASLFRNPTGSFTLTFLKYPSARLDIDEAGKCYAVGRYTAAVFHCMAILQVGLHALANSLGVSFAHSLDLAEWGSVISSIEAKIKPMREGARSDQKDDMLSFYSECASQFRYFKDAWRNHVAHMRETYDRGQAHSILLHVRDFMEKLSTRIPETK